MWIPENAGTEPITWNGQNKARPYGVITIFLSLVFIQCVDLTDGNLTNGNQV